MARLKFKGNIGSFPMYKTQDGFQGREKGGIEPGRVLNDPAFQRTRENLAESGRLDFLDIKKHQLLSTVNVYKALGGGWR